jgi:hypothetical protein
VSSDQEATMNRAPQTIQLTPLQIAHTITALRAHMRALEKKGDEDPEGGEYEDLLIAQSVLKVLMAAGEAADQAGRG